MMKAIWHQESASISPQAQKKKKNLLYFFKERSSHDRIMGEACRRKKNVKIQHVELFYWKYSKDLEEEDAQMDYFPQCNKTVLSTVQSGNGSKVHPHNTELEQHKSNYELSS